MFGVYQQPIQAGMGWPRAVFSLALAIGNLLQGLASPAWASINETFHRPLVIFYIAAAMYVGGLFLFSAAPHVSQSGWVTGVGILTGVGSAGVGLPILLGEVGRLFPAHDPAALRKRSLVFGILPSLGQAGQFVLAPIARALISSVGWIESARILAYQTMIIFPVLILLRRKTPPPMETAKQNVVEKPATAADDEELSEEELSGEQSKSDGSETKRSDGPETAEPKPKPFVAPATVAGPQYVAIPEPPTAWLATKEAFTHVPILFISAAYFTCGWHIGFVSTSMVAWLQDKGMNPQSAAWCLSCLGIGSMFATFLSGFLPSVIKGLRVKWILAGVYVGC